MDDETSLQFQVKTWNEQAAAGKITYQDLETRLRRAAESLDKDFAGGKLKWDEYEAQRTHLILTDAAGQSWRLFTTDGTWRRKVEKTWQSGKPDFSPPPAPKPASSPPPPSAPQSSQAAPAQPAPSPAPPKRAAERRKWVIPVVALAVLALLAAGGPLAASFLGPILNPAPASLPSSTFTTTQTTPTPTQRTVTPTSLPPSTFTVEVVPPTNTLFPTATGTSTPDVISPASTLTPVETSPSRPPSAPTPSGVIAYAAFDERAGTYNIYLRAWPDLKITQMIVPQAGQPAAQKSGGRLAFRAWQTDREGILVMNFQSLATSQAAGIAEAMHPAWSPSGSLAFTANNLPDKKWHLYVNGRVVPIDGSLEGPVWLGDERLAFHGCVAAGCGLFTANVNGSDLRRLTTGDHDFNLAASPAGDRLAFTSDRAGGWDIFTIAADGSQADPVRVTSSPAVEALPAWSPDGRWIAFASDEGGKWGLWMIPAEGGEAQHLFDMEGSPHGFVANGSPSQAGWLQQEQISWFQ